MKMRPLDSPDDARLQSQARQLAEMLELGHIRLATAESCTGGWLAKLCTDIPGSSAWFDCGFVTYSNQAKQRMLGVAAATLDAHGAVSEAVAREMVSGALSHSGADMALAISGIAGPGGGSSDKPVGMVCLAWGRRDGRIDTETCHFDGDRDAVRRQAVTWALLGLMDRV